MHFSAIYFALILPIAHSQATVPIPVVGVQTGLDENTGARPARLNINDLYARKGPQWDLYIQALSDFQAVPESDELSYFQISGIHGYPITPWNGADQVTGGINGGYCPHGETLFATWHRPFVALFEQTLVGHAQTIAARYRGRMAPEYARAALTLRQPYWDWAADHSLPLATILPNLTINTPDGPGTVRNPLYSYRFQKHENGTGFGGLLADYPETVRCPLAGGIDNDAVLSNSNLNLPSLALAPQTYDAFTRATSFDSMASAGSPGPSFEMPHNYIHNYAGCENGTLADLGWSAFDPLFMLHHSNVDRLIAMWQAIYYNDSAMSTTAHSNGAFGSAPGNVTADSPLKPFFDANSTYHTSKTAADTSAFGYTYPEIDDWSKSQEDLKSYVITRVNALYGQGAGIATKQTARAAIRGRGAPSVPVPPGSSSYTAEILVERSEAPLPCVVDLRLGEHTLGTMALLGMPTRGTAYGSIPLGEALHRLNLGGMPESALVPYLQKGLRVEVRKKDGTVLSQDQLPRSLRVELQGQDFTPRASDHQLPGYGAARRWPVGQQARVD